MALLYCKQSAAVLVFCPRPALDRAKENAAYKGRMSVRQLPAIRACVRPLIETSYVPYAF